MFDKPLTEAEKPLVEAYMDSLSQRSRVWHMSYRTPGGRVLSRKLRKELPLLWRLAYYIANATAMAVSTTVSLQILYGIHRLAF